MKRLFAALPAFLFAAACSGGSGDDGDSSGTDESTGDETGGDEELVERGRYLVNDVGMCSFCHTPRLPDGTPDLSNFLAGTDCFDDTVPDNPDEGCMASRNLTSHETGLANFTDDEIKAAIRDGKGLEDGRNMIPVMPSWVFHNMREEDLDAIVAYLRTVPPVDKVTGTNQPPWTPPAQVLTPINPDDIPMPPDDYPEYDRAMNGRYLSTMASSCVDCHTPEDTPFGFDFQWDKIMAGGRGFPAGAFGFTSPPYPEIIFTANLTPDATGIEGWTVDDVVKVMKEGLNPDGEGICAPTHSGPSSPFAGMTQSDLEDIGHFLTSIPPTENMVPEDCVGPPPG